MKFEQYDLMIRLMNKSILIQTNLSEYAVYLRKYFKQVTIPESNPDIIVEAKWQPDAWDYYHKKYKNNPRYDLIADDTLLADNSLVTIRKIQGRKLILEYAFDGDVFHTKQFFFWKGLKDVFRYKYQKKGNEDFFFTITFPVLYYPLFNLLENQGTHVLHASAVRYHQKGVVFCGMEGVGKTCMALELLKAPESRFLSDNLIFFDDRKVFSCFELLRLCPNDEERLKNRFERINLCRSEKNFYRPRQEYFLNEIEPELFLFPVFSHHYYEKKLSVEEAVRLALLSTHLPSEIGNFIDHRHLMAYLKPNCDAWESQKEMLRRLFSRAVCYQVGMPKRDGVEKNLTKVKKLIDQSLESPLANETFQTSV